MSNRIDPSLTQFQTKKFILRSVLFSLGLFLAWFILLFYFYNYLREIEIEDIRQAESTDLEHFTGDVLEYFQSSLSDSYNIARIPQLTQFGDALDPTLRDNLNRYFSTFITRVESYDSIRIIDLDGQELIRVELVNRRANVVPQEKLRLLGACSYFEDLSATPDDGYFISNFDLAQVDCVIQLPPKPVIRSGIPLLNSQGQRYGYLVFDLLVSQEFESMSDHDGVEPGEHSNQIIVANPDGYYLVNQLDRYSTFGFVQKKNADKRFPVEYAEEWAIINSGDDAGQIQTAKGIFTYETIDLASGVFIPYYHQKLNIHTIQPYYKLVSVFTPQRLKHATAALATTLINLSVFAFIGSLAIGIGTAGALGVISMNRRALEEQALHDALTGLPNRKFFMQQLENSMMLNRRRSDVTTVFFIDLDGFKAINDDYGHHAGDHVLQHVSDSVFKTLRKTDFLARLGGDEFVAISYDVNNEKTAALLAKRILDAVSMPTEFNGVSMKVTASIGVALHTDLSNSGEDILNIADSAMYDSKNKGKNQFHIRMC